MSTILRYTGRWVRGDDAASTAGGVRRPAATGSTVAHLFLGRQVRIFGSTGPNAGKADVYLDGAYAATVDTYSTIPRAQQIWFDTGVLHQAATGSSFASRARRTSWLAAPRLRSTSSRSSPSQLRP